MLVSFRSPLKYPSPGKFNCFLKQLNINRNIHSNITTKFNILTQKNINIPFRKLNTAIENEKKSSNQIKQELLKVNNKILLIKGQGIGPECINAAKTVLDSTGLIIEYKEGSLGYPDAKKLFTILQQKMPEIYTRYFGQENPIVVAERLETDAKQKAKTEGNINDFYKKLLSKLEPEVIKEVKTIIFDLEKKTLQEAQSASAVLKGALRTLDEGDEPSRNVTIRKAFEQYANIRRCVTLDPIVPGIKGADILFVRENVEDLYASIEHVLARNYPQALRHQTPEGCELICRAAFEAALREGRKKVTAFEKPNILKITGGLFKNIFFSVAKDYSKEKLGEHGIEANFMIIDDGLAAIAVTPEIFDVVVTSNMFGDIGSDVAAKVTGGVGLVSSNNINPNNPKSVSMFETMGGTADDIAGQNKANPIALIDAAAEMLLHIGGKDNIIAAELIKTSIMEVLGEGYYVGDIRKGHYQEAKGKQKLGTQEFTQKIVEKIRELKVLKEQHPEKTIKQIAIGRSNEEIKPLFKRVLRSYEQYAIDMLEGSHSWIEYVKRNIPPNPVRASSKIVGFDLFVDNSGVKSTFGLNDTINQLQSSKVDEETAKLFYEQTGINFKLIFNEGNYGSIQAIRSFGQYSARILGAYLNKYPYNITLSFGTVLEEIRLGERFTSFFSDYLKQENFADALVKLQNFEKESIKLIQSFYIARAKEIEPVLIEHGFKLVRITSRGTEIYPTMCDFEKREIDRFRIEIDPTGPLAKIVNESYNHVIVQLKIVAVQAEIAKKGWIISEIMLNRNFIDGEGPNLNKEMKGVSVPYAKDLGFNYKNSSYKKDKEIQQIIKAALEEVNIAISEAEVFIRMVSNDNQSAIAKFLLNNLIQERKLIIEKKSIVDQNDDVNTNGVDFFKMNKEFFENIQEALIIIKENRQNIKIMKDYNMSTIIKNASSTYSPFM